MNEKPEALQFADDRPSSWNVDDLYQWATDAEELIRSMQARITELEKDAERYRWLRQLDNAFDYTALINRSWNRAHTPSQLDHSIDTAMQKD